MQVQIKLMPWEEKAVRELLKVYFHQPEGVESEFFNSEQILITNQLFYECGIWTDEEWKEIKGSHRDYVILMQNFPELVWRWCVRRDISELPKTMLSWDKKFASNNKFRAWLGSLLESNYSDIRRAYGASKDKLEDFMERCFQNMTNYAVWENFPFLFQLGADLILLQKDFPVEVLRLSLERTNQGQVEFVRQFVSRFDSLDVLQKICDFLLPKIVFDGIWDERVAGLADFVEQLYQKHPTLALPPLDFSYLRGQALVPLTKLYLERNPDFIATLKQERLDVLEKCLATQPKYLKQLIELRRQQEVASLEEKLKEEQRQRRVIDLKACLEKLAV